MSGSEKDRTELTKALSKLEPEELDKLHQGLLKTKSSLEDLNSAYPTTQEFLRQRGLTNVRELDAQGREDLKRHLEGTLAAFKSTQKFLRQRGLTEVGQLDPQGLNELRQYLEGLARSKGAN